MKVICRFLASETMEEFVRTRNTHILFYILLRSMFEGYCCEPGSTWLQIFIHFGTGRQPLRYDRIWPFRLKSIFCRDRIKKYLIWLRWWKIKHEKPGIEARFSKKKNLHFLRNSLKFNLTNSNGLTHGLYRIKGFSEKISRIFNK